MLSGDRMTIGRRSRTRGTAPDIDLAELDPAVSAAHALLVARSGGWDLVDLGSSNGTTLAVEDGPIRPHTPVPLARRRRHPARRLDHDHPHGALARRSGAGQSR